MKQENSHAHSPAELQKNLHAIEEELKKPVDHKTMRKLFQKLEIAQEDCSLMKPKYNISCLPECEERIRTLFGTVVTTHVDSEVDTILSRANLLSKDDHKATKALKKQISSLKSWHRPSKENLLKLAKAESKLEGVCDLPCKEEHSNPFEALELLELASLVYHKNKEERNKLYCSLSSASKECFQKHLGRLKTKAFEEQEKTIRALFIAACELAGIPVKKDPTPLEMDEFFSEPSTESNCAQKSK